MSDPLRASIEDWKANGGRWDVPEMAQFIEALITARSRPSRLRELLQAHRAQVNPWGTVYEITDAEVDDLEALLSAGAVQPQETELRDEIAKLSAAWLKAGEGWERDPAGRVVLRHGQVLRDVLKRTELSAGAREAAMVAQMRYEDCHPRPVYAGLTWSVSPLDVTTSDTTSELPPDLRNSDK